MTGSEAETEIRGVLAEMSTALRDADVPALDKLLSDCSGSVYIGTDPDEWCDKAQMLADIKEAGTSVDGSVRAERGEDFIHVHGDVAWVEGTAKFLGQAGQECPVRRTGVLVHEDGVWRVAQFHVSIGVPNADMFTSY